MPFVPLSPAAAAASAAQPRDDLAASPVRFVPLTAQAGAAPGAAPAGPPVPGAPVPERTWGEAALDTGIDLAKGTIGLGESVVGLTDLVTGNLTGRALAAIGFDPERAKRMLASGYSDERKAADKAVQDAEGFVDTTVALLKNPSAAAGSIVESAPLMLGSAAAARGLAIKMLAARGIAPGTAAATKFLSQPAVAAKLAAAGSATEGLMQAGSLQETGRQAGKDWGDTVAPALASGAGTAAIGMLSSKIPGFRDVESSVATAGLKGAGAAQSAGAVVKQIAKDTFKEGVLEELPQSAQEQVWQNIALGRPWDEGVGEAAAQGMVAGAGMGGGMSMYQAGRDLTRSTAAPAPAAPAAPPVADAVPDTERAEAEAPAPAPPRVLTALDRVQAIDAELAAAPPEADTSALQAERAALSKDWPATVPGAPTQFSTEAGTRLSGQYALIEADDLQASHDRDLRPNPAFPADLQPRQRDRAASATQIAGIVSRLDPARLGESATAADGAPIIGADGLVESGNARTIALQRVYASGGLKAHEYRTWLAENAGRFGLARQQVEGMRRPVLVRVRQTPIDRAEFARQANAPTVAAMSPTEQALADAARIDSMDDLRPDEQGDFATSRSFIRRFVGRLPETERGALVDAQGQLSAPGYARVRNAVMAKAYGNSPVLGRLVESMNEGGRNIGRALMMAAPRMAQMRSMIEAGRRHPADLTPALTEAAAELERLRQSGQGIEDALRQGAIDGQGRSPEAAKLLQFMAENARRPRRIADLLTAYADALDAAGDPAQGDLLGGGQAPTVGALLDGAIGELNRGMAPPAAQAANEPTGPDWVQFAPESGTLGIPRSEMPQVRLKDRGAMVNFLNARGIAHEIVEVDPDSLKPTQSEFSRTKVRKSMNAEGDTATALISADGYVIDGHHRWLAQKVKREPLRALRFDAPAQQVLDAIHEFPSSYKSRDSEVDPRRAAVQDFKDALADLGDLLTQHQRAALVSEKAPTLHKTLVRLFDAGIRILGTDLKRLTAYVRSKLKEDPATKKHWNKVTAEEYRRAAEEALAQVQRGVQQPGLFDSEAAADQALQGDLFAWAQAAQPEVDAVSAARPAPPAPAPSPKPSPKPSAKPAADLFDSPAPPLVNAPELILGENPPPKNKPVVLVFGGSFNPAHAGHKMAAQDARQMLLDAGYKVDKVVISPSPQRLLKAKSGAQAQELEDRTAMAKLVFQGEDWAEVTSEPSRQAEEIEGKLKRTQQADWARAKYPDATIVSLTGQDAAPGSPPGFPSLYQGDPGTSHEGYYYFAVPRDESSADNISSSKIRKLIEQGEEVPQAWEASEVVRYFRALRGLSGEVAIDGKLYDLDAPHFGLPEPARPLPDGHPLLQETDKKAEYEFELDGKIVRGPRSELHDKIVAKFFKGVEKPAAGQRPVLVVMGGGGAAGKGTILRLLRSRGEIMPPHQAVHIDPDQIKDEIPEYADLLKAGDTRAAGVAHEESSALRNRIESRALAERYNVVLDVTLGNQTKGLALLKRYKEAGYEIRLIGVTIDPATAAVRAIKRATEPGDAQGRWVPMEELLKAHKAFTPAFESYAALADSAVLYDNSNGARVKLVEKKLGGELQFIDMDGYNLAVERANRVDPQATTLRGIREGVPGVQRSGGEPAGAGKPGGGPEVSVRGSGRQAVPGHDARGSGPEGAVRGDDRQARAGSAGPVPGVGGSNVDAADDANARPGAQGPGAAAVPADAGKRGAPVVPAGEGRGGRLGDRDAGDGAGQGQRPAVSGAREGAQQPAAAGDGGSDRRGRGVPAGRAIKPKSGLNWRFADDEISPRASWAKRAEANVAAVELVKKLDKEGRAATPEERAVLAQFVGWGASDLANRLFGTKLDAVQRVLPSVEKALAAFDKRGNKPMRREPYGGRYSYASEPEGWYDALRVLQYGDPKFVGYTATEITREQVEKAAPSKADQRWLALRERLRKALTPEEYAEAERTTQYGHFTSAPIVRGMWRALQRMGFRGGLVLEAGAGKGNFPGLMPEDMAVNSAYTGIEYDSVTGAILRHLFPDEHIRVESFVDTKLPRDHFDVGIGNPPFSGTIILGDPEYRKLGFALHDFFLAKTLDRLRPGGLFTVITSRYTMDKADSGARDYIAERADLLGAIRLPQSAFKANAGTEVVTDVLFFRKRVPGENPLASAQPWLNTKTVQVGDAQVVVNEYFAAHPEMILGTPAMAGSMYSKNEYTVLPAEGDIAEQFNAAVDRLPANVFSSAAGSNALSAQVRAIDMSPTVAKEGSFYVAESGALMRREHGVGLEVVTLDKRGGKRADGLTAKDQAVIRDYIPLRDALKQAQWDQLHGLDWETSLKALQQAYQAFVAKHGRLKQSVVQTRNVKVTVEDEDADGNIVEREDVDEVEVRIYPLLASLRKDPDWTLVAALEEVNDDTGEIKEAPTLRERVLGGRPAARVATPHDALLTVLDDLGRVDIPEIARRLDIGEAEAIEALGSAVYLNPVGGKWEMADEYLSGEVRRKLDEARAAAKTDARYERNIKALEAVQPAALSPAQISVVLGQNWIPMDVYEEFLRSVGVSARVRFDEASRKWSISYTRAIKHGERSAATQEWGTMFRHAGDLFMHAVEGRQVKIYQTVKENGKERQELLTAETAAANDKLTKLKDEFAAWIWRDEARTARLVKLYNERFNTLAPRSFDGRHLTLPGSSNLIDVYDHVKRGAWRIIQSGNTYLAHAVGSGKTWATVISAMEQRRLGLIKKPMFVVPNHMLGQFAQEWLQLYPAAKLMVADEENFVGDKRREFVARAALNDLDGIIITHDAFKKLDIDPKFKAKMLREEVAALRAAAANAEEVAAEDTGKKGGRGGYTVKRLNKRIEQLEERIKALTSGEGKDKNVRIDEMGVDMLYVDEAHVARRLEIATSRQVKGISTAGSEIARTLYTTARWLEEQHPGRSLVMMSGTPITNTMGELYTVQRFLGRQALIDRGIEDFDSWAAMFGRETSSLEATVAGTYEMVTRFKNFANVSDLTRMFRQFADVLNADHLAAVLGDKRPKVEGGRRITHVVPMTSDLRLVREQLRQRVEASRRWKPSRDEPNNPDPIIAIIGDGRLAAIDHRFLLPGSANNPDSKLNKLADSVIQAYHEGANVEYRDKKTGKPFPIKGTAMMVFSDVGFGEGARGRGFNARAWFEKRLRDGGVNMAQVAWMSDYKKSSEKVRLFRDVNAGRIRILIGSSKNMGTGVNAQQRLRDLFHLDAPWFPADVEQREGRAIRQGNLNPQVRLHVFSVKGSYDQQMWQLIASKQRFIDQAMSGDPNIREISDLSEASQQEQISAMLADDPRVLELAGKRVEIERMDRLYQAHENDRQRARDRLSWAETERGLSVKALAKAEENAGKTTDLSGDNFTAYVGAVPYTKRAEWVQNLKARANELAVARQPAQTIGRISGFPVRFVTWGKEDSYAWEVRVGTGTEEGGIDPTILRSLGDDDIGVARRATYAVAEAAQLPAKIRDRIAQLGLEVERLRAIVARPFELAEELAAARRDADRLAAEIAAGPPFDAEEFDEALAGAAYGMVDTDLDPMAFRLSRGSGAGMDPAAVRGVVQRLRRDYAGLPPVEVLPSPTHGSVPPALARFIRERGATVDAEGAFYDGKIYLFASGLSDQARVEHVLVEHEAAHAGLAALLGSGRQAAMQALYNLNPGLRAQVAPAVKAGMSIAEAVEEAIVDMPSDELARLEGWRKVVGRVRDWLARRGFAGLVARLDGWLAGHLTEQQRADLLVADLVREARTFARTRSAERDARLQADWLLKRAKARGFADVDAFAAQDFDGFMAAAEQWRTDHPAAALMSVSTDAFRRWFGDSKVVDAEGKPRLVYHGTSADFTVFKPGAAWFSESPQHASRYAVETAEKAGKMTGRSALDVAGMAGMEMQVMPVYLAIRNPLEIPVGMNMPPPKAIDLARKLGLSGGQFRKATKVWEVVNSPAFIEAARKAGYDGVRAQEGDAVTWAAFDATQIKSATGNRGTYSPTNPDIRMSRAKAAATLLSRGNISGMNAVQAAAQQIADAIAAEKESDPFADYALRALPGDANGVEPGDVLPESFRWEDGEQTDERLDGTSAILVRPPHDRERVMAALVAVGATGIPPHETPNGVYRGTRFALVKGESVGPGEDVGEVIVADATVVALWRRDDTVWRAIVPNESSAPAAAGETRLSRAAGAAHHPAAADVASRAERIIQASASTPRPVDAAFRLVTRATGVERLASIAYGLGARLIERITPERIKAGIVSDYGIPQAVQDRRGEFHGAVRGQMLKAGALLEKLATMTRAEARVAYEWMTGEDTRTADELMQELPAESVAVLNQIRNWVDALSDEAVKLGQLDPEARARHRMAYLRRSYFKHAADLTAADRERRSRAIAIFGEQYRGRGMVRHAPMKQIQNVAPEWWKRKLQAGKADTALKGEKFIRFERRAPAGAGVDNLPGVESERRPGRLLEVHFWPADQAVPARYADWERAGTWEVVDTKGDDLLVWRDFTKEERVRMGEIDEARYAIAKTLQGMIHDIEVGKYLQWLAHTQAKKPGEEVDGVIVQASESYRDTFKAVEWVVVPDTKIAGTNVPRYGHLAGRLLPGPIWNDVRQLNNRFMPLGETFQAILRAWKISKTALSPAVHMNNLMSNFVMADWHDVSAGHVAKSLQIILAAQAGRGKGGIGAVGNLAGKTLGIADQEAAREILARYEASGGSIGGWVAQELNDETMQAVRDALRVEANAAAAASGRSAVGVYAALQALLQGKLPTAYEALRGTKAGEVVATEGRNLIDLYQAEDDIFRLAAWLKAKEGGSSDADAGRVARRSFLDYSINAPWVATMRATAWPFISYTYRAVPMLLEVAGKRPHKLLKLVALAGALNALGVMLAGDSDDDDERRRRLLPEEKAGRIWGAVPKLIRMPWNDAHGSPVYLDIRRWIPVGDVLDLGQGNAALPVPPSLLPGGPLAVLGEVVFNLSMFTGEKLTLDTDTYTEKGMKVADHLWKAAAPNIVGMPGTYATEGVIGSITGRTDAFGRELSPAQALTSSVGVKLGSYPDDVLRRNLAARSRAAQAELDDEIAALKRQYATNRISEEDFNRKLDVLIEKKREAADKVREKLQ